MILRDGGPPVPIEHQPIILKFAQMMLDWMVEQQALTEETNEKSPAPAEALDSTSTAVVTPSP